MPTRRNGADPVTKTPEQTVADLEARLATIEDDMAARKARIEEVRQKRAREIKLRLRRARYAVAAKERKRETRRNILAGAWVRQKADDDPRIRSWLADGLADSLTRPHDRELFDLDPMPEE